MFKDQEFKAVRNNILSKQLVEVNVKHIDTMKTIEGLDPKFAKHMFLRNELLESFSKNMGGGVNVLEQPMCNHCERVAAWHTGGKAHCFSCNQDTPADKVITVKKYLLEYMKGMTEEQLQMLNSLGGERKNEIIR